MPLAFLSLAVFSSPPGVAAAAGAPSGAPGNEAWGYREPLLVAAGAPESLVKGVRSAVLIPGAGHADLWVHPELFGIPGRPEHAEFRARTTDRLGKDAHSTWHYFATSDGFRTLQPLAQPTPELWSRKDLAMARLLPSADASVRLPDKLGHTWCSAFVYLDAQTVLQAFTTQTGIRYSVRSLIARVEPNGLRPLYVSEPRSIDVGRGLYEPHVVFWRGRCYMTVRAEDRRGYVLVSDDRGRTWTQPRPWCWDDGEVIAMNQTMTKFAAHDQGLVLVYTRIRPDNENAFRNRAPLHVADVDPERLALRRTTERVIVPNRSIGPKGLPVGNFWVWPMTQKETYVTVAEWPRDGRPQNGDIWLTKIEWRSPNRLLTEEGREAILVH